MPRRRPKRRKKRRRDEEEEEEDEEEEEEEDEDDYDDEDEDDEDDYDDEDEAEYETVEVKPLSKKKAKKLLKKAKKAMDEDFEEGVRLPIFQAKLGEFYSMTLEDIQLTQYRTSGEYHNAGDGLIRVTFSDPDCVRLVAEKLAEGKQWLRKRKDIGADLPLDVIWGISKQKSKTSRRSFHLLYLEEQ